MNFPNDNSTQTGIVNVSYTPTYANINNPNILFNDLKSGIYNPLLNTIKLFTNNIKNIYYSYYTLLLSLFLFLLLYMML